MKRAALLVALLTGPVWGDVVILRDGTRLEGDLKRTPDGYTITLLDGQTRSFPADAIRSMQPGGSAARGPSQEAAGLASLRRSVEAVSSLDEIISRYQRFIETAKDPTLVTEARSDLAGWQAKKQQGLVKHGSVWVSPEQVQELAVAATLHALDARDLIRQSRTREAEQALQKALAIDPQNTAVQYLRGVVFYRQDRLVDARKAFDAVSAGESSHAPTLHNIAVILWRQNQPAGALTFYDQAMQASPVNDFILTNVAEALGSMADEQRRGNPYMRAMRRFAEQDQVLQQRMAQQGKYRWGSQWLDEAKLNELKAAEREIKQKLEAAQTEYDQAGMRINSIDGEIKSNENIIVGLRINAAMRDGRGNIVMITPPAEYYELQRRNEVLLAEAETLKAKMASLADQSRRLQQELPVPRFTGVQHIVGVEGMPGAPPAPVTQPAP